METVVSKRFLFLVVSAVLALPSLTAARTIRIVQTNAAGDNIHLIDPATNKVVAEITKAGGRAVALLYTRPGEGTEETLKQSRRSASKCRRI